MPTLAISMEKRCVHKQNFETKDQILIILSDIAESNFTMTSH